MLKQVVLLMTTIKHVKMYFTKKTNAEYSVTGMDWKGNKENYLKTSRENVLVEKKWRFSHPLKPKKSVLALEQWVRLIGHVRVPKTPTFKMRPSEQPFLWKMSCICIRMKNHLHIKGWTLNLVLIQRPAGTRKWPIRDTSLMKTENLI